MRYRRAEAAGGTYLFTVNLAERRSDVLVRHIDNSRTAMKTVNDNWRLTFAFEGEDAILVNYQDYY